MEIYIEYAFAENFLFDGILLYLTFQATRSQIRFKRLCFTAFLGGVFALVYPLLHLPSVLMNVLKITVGFLLVLCLQKWQKGGNVWGRFALNVIFFFVFTFAFGGALSALFQTLPSAKPSTPSIVLAFFALAIFSIVLIKKMLAKKAVSAFLYPCEIEVFGECIQTTGFWDSGNRAALNGIPVCFVSVWLLAEKVKNHSEKRMRILTVDGEREIPLYDGILRLQLGKKQTEKRVYFSPSRNIISREYEIILHASLLK